MRQSTGKILAIHKFCAFALAMVSTLLLAACAGAPELSPAEQPLVKETRMLLGHKGMDPTAPIFVRIFKEESELEVWKARDDGRFYHLKTYPICNWSGALGPKINQGDKQSPEGFYTVSSHQMNPNSKFHVAFNLGYPNAYDRSKGRTGNFLMVHGKCKSAGCYAMTDALVEEIYALAREAFKGGQQAIEVHAFPFRMTSANMQRHKKNRWARFWKVLKRGYDHFETHRLPPTVAVCERRYVVNVHLPVNGRKPRADAACPRFNRPMIEPFVPKLSEQQIASERVFAPGPKTRRFAHQTAPTSNQQIASSPAPSNASVLLGLGGPPQRAIRPVESPPTDTAYGFNN